MDDYAKYEKTFVDCFGVEKGDVSTLEYQSISSWDSVAHMTLVATIEEVFEITMDIDDIIDFSSFDNGREILRERYGVAI